MKDNMFEAFRASIYNYVFVDDLTPRVSNRVKEVHSKNYYDMERVDGLIDTSPQQEDTMMEDEDGGI